MDDFRDVQRMVDHALFVERFDALVVAELRQYDPQHHRLVAVGDEHWPAAIALEGCEVNKEGLVDVDRRQRMAGDGAVTADGEAGVVGLEARRVTKDGNFATDV